MISPVDNRCWIAGYLAFKQLGPDVKKTCECFRALLNLLNVFISPPCIKGILTRNSGNFCFWNLESWALKSKCSSRNPVSHQRLESGSQVPLTKNSDSLPGIRNPRLSWIPLNGMLNHSLVPSRPRRFRM